MSGSHHGAQAASITASSRSLGHRVRPIHRPSLRLIAGPALASFLVLGAAGPAAAHDPTGGLRPGDLVRDNGISVVVPEPGHMIWGELKLDDGTSRTLSVETDRSGTVRVLHRADEAAAGSDAHPTGATALVGAQAATTGIQTAAQPDGSSGSSGECSDRSYSRFSFRTPHLQWRYASGTTPSKFRARTNGTSQVINALRRANRNITESRNLCGRSDKIGAQGTYLGTTSGGPNVSSSGSCTGGDGRSVIGWGSLPSSSIAMACVSGLAGGVAYEGDIRINWNKAYETKSRYCSGELLISAAMTHEFGHLYGMAHVSSYSSPHLTMQPRVSYCSRGHARLGLGDMLGLETKY